MKVQLRKGTLTAAAETAGGELVSLRDGEGREYIWDGDPTWWSGRNPVLFPIVGGLKEGKVCFGGREYEMGRHGFARRSEFSLAGQGEDFVDFRLTESPETLARYPFPFSLTVRHRLLEDGFSTEFLVENTGHTELPFCVGAHTAFRCPMEEGEAFTDYELVFREPEALDSPLLTPEGLVDPGRSARFLDGGDRLPLDYGVFAEVDTMIFEGLRSGQVKLVSRKTGRGVAMEFGEFPMLAFWTKPGAPFLCLEPWQGCAAYADESGVFTDKPHCVTLAPGEKKSLAYRVTLLR